jgi:hypothetical protein
MKIKQIQKFFFSAFHYLIRFLIKYIYIYSFNKFNYHSMNLKDPNQDISKPCYLSFFFYIIVCHSFHSTNKPLPYRSNNTLPQRKAAAF